MTLPDSWVSLPAGYKADYRPCDDGVYWHLYCAGERINGGISCDYAAAQELASRYAHRHRGPVRGEDGYYVSVLDVDDLHWRRDG